MHVYFVKMIRGSPLHAVDPLIWTPCYESTHAKYNKIVIPSGHHVLRHTDCILDSTLPCHKENQTVRVFRGDLQRVDRLS